MSYKSNIYVCVTGCTQKGTVDPEGNRVGFFGFPKYQNLRQEWLVKIRRDFGTYFKLREATKVCSLHFHPSDVKKGIESVYFSANRFSIAKKNEIQITFSFFNFPRRREGNGIQIHMKIRVL